jgi:hypothetical protein
MIIVQLKGGLGNQLFQYAAGLSLAHYHQTILKADISQLNQKDKQINTYRSFDLRQTLADPIVATESEIQWMQSQDIFSKYLDKLRPPHKRKIYREDDFRFDNNFFKAANDTYLQGYRQSEKYFLSIGQKIRDIFRIREEAISKVKDKGRQLSSVNSIAIHIRRGDYSNKIVRDFHGILDETYYRAAIRHFETLYDDCHFLIFSDDPEWVNNKLSFHSVSEMISGKYTSSAIEDFYLISQCKHQVIANSTFSWWAAWLNPNPGKIVVAPEKWFNNAPYDTRDLIPETWLKM